MSRYVVMEMSISALLEACLLLVSDDDEEFESRLSSAPMTCAEPRNSVTFVRLINELRLDIYTNLFARRKTRF